MSTVQKYYPPVSDLIDATALPGDLEAIENLLQQGVDFLLGHIYYKDLVVEVYNAGDTKYYSLVILTKSLKLPLLADINLVFFYGEEAELAEFPIVFEWSWPIFKYIPRFETQGFSYAPEAFLDILIDLSEINDRQEFFNQIVSVFLDDGSDMYLDFFDNLTSYLFIYENGDTNVTNEIQNIVDNIEIIKNEFNVQLTATNLFTFQYLYENYQTNDVLNTAVEEINQSIETLNRQYNVRINIYRDILINLLLNLSNIDEKFNRLLQLFRNWMADIDLDDIKSFLIPQFSFTLHNINMGLEFPRKWLVPVYTGVEPVTGLQINDPLPEPFKSTLLFNVGSLNYSTRSAFTFDNQSDFTFKRALIGNTGLLVEFHNLKVDMSDSYNIPEAIADGRPDNFQGVYAAKAAITLPSKWFNDVDNTSLQIAGYNMLVGTGGLSGTIALETVNGIPATNDDYLNLKLGNWDLGFNRFDILFKQNEIVESNIRGKLQIPKFVDPETNAPVDIIIEGHLDSNGDFDLTSSFVPPYPIKFPDVFTYRLKTVQLGREDNDFYLGTSGTLQFEGFLKEVLKLGPIEIERLRIYSNGTIEFAGGSVQLIEPVVLPLGPVEITVSAIHYGSHQKEVNGVMRKFNYFGFDGGVSIDPLGIEVRGDGVKYYYCVDDVEGYEKPKPYLHIKTLHLDLTIPANSGSLAQISGWVTIPEPGVSKEYAGGITLQIPKAKLAGKADIKLTPKYPAFIVDCELEMPVPIPLGSFAIYGFRGLLGYRYVAEKEAIGMNSDNSWYEYYKAPKLGINVHKFSNPEQTVNYQNNVTLGAGATLGTSADNGYTFSLKAMALFSIPSFFMIDGRAAILSARLGLDDTKEPPFFAFVMVGDDSLELGIGANYKLPDSGKILHIQGQVEMGFYFKNQKPWFINIGTKTNPIQARIIDLVNIQSFLMMSAKGIEAGSRGDFNFDRDYGVIKVQASAFIEIGGKISFERPQFGAYLMAGASARIKVLFVRLTLELKILFGVEAPKPFLIYGEFYFKVKVGIKIFRKRITIFKFSGNLEVVWNFNKTVDRSPVNPLIVSVKNPDAMSAAEKAVVGELVQGVNMLSNETFLLAYLESVPTASPDQKILNHIIPLDTYVDIKTEKGLLPGDANDPNNSVRKLIGGVNNAASGYADFIPPVSSIKGREMRQVIHQYSIEHLEIKFWNELKANWEDYHPYEALYPNDQDISNLKVGQFQKTDGKYNAVRILATTPFSYTEQGEPGWHVPEQYGINASTLFCEAEHREPKCIDFLLRPLNAKYYCSNPNTPLFSNDVSFRLLTSDEEEYAYVTDEPNVFNFSKSLAFDNRNSMEIVLPEPTIMARFKLSNAGGNGVRVKFYSVIKSPENDVLFNVVYGNPDPDNQNVNTPYEMILSTEDLNEEIKFNFTYSNSEEWMVINPDWRPISKIVIEPVFNNTIDQQIDQLTEQIAEIQNNNELISLGIITGDIIPTEPLEEELDLLICESTGQLPTYFINRYNKADKLNYYYSKEFREDNKDFIYSIGSTEKKGLISKIDVHGNLVWERTYMLEKQEKDQKLVFKRIIRTEWKGRNEYIIYASTNYGDHYLIRFEPSEGDIIWSRKIDWKDKSIFVYIAPVIDEPFFYLVVSDRNELNSDGKPFVAKVNSSAGEALGTLLDIENEEFIVNTICEDDHGLVLAGRFIEGKYGDSIGAVIHLDRELNIINTLMINENFTTIHDIKPLDYNRYLISGYDNKHDGIFVSLVSDEGIHSFYQIPNTLNHNSEIHLSEKGFYLLCNDDDNGILHFLTTDFIPLWSKTINLNSGSNGIRNFTFNRNSEKLTFNCFNQIEGSLVVHLNKELQSCLTKILDIPRLYSIELPTQRMNVRQEFFHVVLYPSRYNSELIKNTIIKKYCKGIDCGEEDPTICTVYGRVLVMYENCLIDPTTTLDINFKNVSGCFTTILELLNTLDPKSKEAIAKQIELINTFLKNQDMQSYIMAWEATGIILEYLKETGNCVCVCDSGRFTMIHQVCWMSVENYTYNINIPSQEAIEADAQAAIDGITKYIQPVWRPDTSYYIHFVLKDTVDNGANTKLYPYTYGFTTAGPVGYFHTDNKSTYGEVKLRGGDMLFNDNHTYFIVDASGKKLLNGADNSLYLSNANGFILDETTGALKDAVTKNAINKPGTSDHVIVNAHPDKYPLTSLAQYIDYNRSYPNANGNLLSAKPLFYNDEEGETTQIYLFFNKAYATHFFQKWEPYKGAVPIAGQIKIVIKDPVEDISIVNPPHLNYDEDYTEIPQSIEVWEGEGNPQIPFAINQYLSMYNASHCIGEVTVIKPASKYAKITPKNLKPNKLYTVIVNNMYDVNHNGTLDHNVETDETKEIHKFVFKTSRYKDFEEQIQSFYMKQEINGELSERKAVFNFEKEFTQDEINASYVTILNWHNDEDNQQPITGFTTDVIETLNNSYQHPYDRIFEGILGLTPWDAPVSTEVNILKDVNPGNVIALIIRNPEPFNNPKFRKEVMKDTIEIIVGGQVDPSYSVLFSKDNSQVIVMNTAKNIRENFSLRFKYKVYEDHWPGDDIVINYPIKAEEELHIELFNN